MAKIIDGKAIAAEINAETEVMARKLTEKFRAPGLAVVLVGDDPASQVYVRNKVRTCGELGIRSELHKLDASATEDEVLALIAKLNADASLDGILVQSPPPKHIDEGGAKKPSSMPCFSE